MAKTRILRLPPGEKVPNSPRIDRVERDESLDGPVIVTEDDADPEAVRRDKISQGTHDVIGEAWERERAATEANDTTARVDELEIVLEHLTHITLGLSVDELLEELKEAREESTSDTSTDESTSA
ncbi:hypothetical protein HRTV-21_gp33 [Halorubrum virus HRTV-21]|nr:hypothetical protein HRTV-21_gp33 [Halorubrum virus HRTV-21]